MTDKIEVNYFPVVQSFLEGAVVYTGSGVFGAKFSTKNKLEEQIKTSLDISWHGGEEVTRRSVPVPSSSDEIGA